MGNRPTGYVVKSPVSTVLIKSRAKVSLVAEFDFLYFREKEKNETLLGTYGGCRIILV